MRNQVADQQSWVRRNLVTTGESNQGDDVLRTNRDKTVIWRKDFSNASWSFVIPDFLNLHSKHCEKVGELIFFCLHLASQGLLLHTDFSFPLKELP